MKKGAAPSGALDGAAQSNGRGRVDLPAVRWVRQSHMEA